LYCFITSGKEFIVLISICLFVGRRVHKNNLTDFHKIWWTDGTRATEETVVFWWSSLWYWRSAIFLVVTIPRVGPQQRAIGGPSGQHRLTAGILYS